MAAKTITLDMEAYKLLKARKKADESFSDVVKRIAPKPIDLEAFFQRVRENPLSDGAAEAIEQVVASRGRRHR